MPNLSKKYKSLSDIKKSNATLDMVGGNIPVDMDIDSRFSKYVYEFLNGKSNDLPNYESINNLMKDAYYDYISVGYGVSISKTDTIKIAISKAFEDNAYRLDEITPTEYKANFIDVHGGIKPIDINEDSLYNPKRIQILQDYLGKYLEEYPLVKGTSR